MSDGTYNQDQGTAWMVFLFGPLVFCPLLLPVYLLGGLVVWAVRAVKRSRKAKREA